MLFSNKIPLFLLVLFCLHVPKVFSQESQSQPEFIPISEVSIKVNLPRLTLELYKQGELVREFPVAIGQAQFKTPSGEYFIKRIEWNPTWYPPPSDWAKDDKVTPPGPGNPLGPVKMVFDGDLRIHGTSKPGSVGRAASHGCLRMKNEEAKELAWYLQIHNSDKTDEELREKYKKHSRSTFVVNLNTEVPVSFEYETVVLKEDRLEIYPDVYGKTKKLKDEIISKLALTEFDIQSLDEGKLDKLKKPSKGKLEILFQDLILPNHTSMNGLATSELPTP